MLVASPLLEQSIQQLRDKHIGKSWQKISPIRNDYLFLSGSKHSSLNREAMDTVGITYVVNMAKEIHCPFSHLQYLHVKAEDNETERLSPHFEMIATFISNARAANGKILVHCHMGRSRSVTALIAYLMLKENMRLQDAWKLVKASRDTVNPNPIFCMELRQLEKDIFGEYSKIPLVKRDDMGDLFLDWTYSLSNLMQRQLVYLQSASLFRNTLTIGQPSPDLNGYLRRSKTGQDMLFWAAFEDIASPATNNRDEILCHMLKTGFCTIEAVGQYLTLKQSCAFFRAFLVDGCVRRNKMTLEEAIERVEQALDSEGWKNFCQENQGRLDTNDARIWGTGLSDDLRYMSLLEDTKNGVTPMADASTTTIMKLESSTTVNAQTANDVASSENWHTDQMERDTAHTNSSVSQGKSAEFNSQHIHLPEPQTPNNSIAVKQAGVPTAYA
jgi:protein-tyrosine phosphatase